MQTHGFFVLMGGFTVLDNGKQHPFFLSHLEKRLVAEDVKITKEFFFSPLWRTILWKARLISPNSGTAESYLARHVIKTRDTVNLLTMAVQ